MLWFRSALLVLVASSVVWAGAWPQWLGPNRDGSSSEKVAAWKQPPKVLWRQPVGEGHSSPVIAAGRVFLHARVRDKDEEEVTAYEAQSGKEIWRKSYPRAAFKSMFGLGPRATPASAGDKVYTNGVTGVLSCWEADTGKQLWQVDTLKTFKADNLFFGISCSPLVDGETVFTNVGGKGASIVAFNKDKGAVVWKALDDRASYSSPILVGQGNSRQLIFLTQQGLVSLAPADGSMFWKFPLVDQLSESSTTPMLIGDLLLGSSVTYGSACLRLTGKDGKVAAVQAWKNPELTCYFSTPVAVGKEHAYLVTGALVPPSVSLRCVEAATGKVLWSRPKVGAYHAALLRTGDSKLLMLDDAGNLILIEPNPKEYRELARAKICGPTWSHPALSDGRLYLRDDQELICFQLGQ